MIDLTSSNHPPLRSYSDENDSDYTPTPNKLRKILPKPGRGGAAKRGRADRAGKTARGRDRSRSPDRTIGKGKNVRIREPESEDEEPDTLEGLTPIVAFKAGIDPDNLKKARSPDKTKSNEKSKRKGRLNGSKAGRKPHQWTASE